MQYTQVHVMSHTLYPVVYVELSLGCECVCNSWACQTYHFHYNHNRFTQILAHALTFKWESHGPHAIVLSSVRDPHTHSHSSGSVVQRVRHTYVNVRESLIRAKMINLACPRTSAPISTSVMHNA